MSVTPSENLGKVYHLTIEQKLKVKLHMINVCHYLITAPWIFSGASFGNNGMYVKFSERLNQEKTTQG